MEEDREDIRELEVALTEQSKLAEVLLSLYEGDNLLNADSRLIFAECKLLKEYLSDLRALNQDYNDLTGENSPDIEHSISLISPVYDCILKTAKKRYAELN